MSDWEGLRVLLAVSRAGSISAAGRSLGLDTATVSRRVAALEHSLGVPLVARGARGSLVPTSAGAELLAVAARTEQALADAQRAARAEHDAPAGLVRVTTTDVLAVHILAPRLRHLHALHPGLVLDLLVTPQLVDLAREADLALRLARPSQGNLVVRRAGSLPLGVFAADAWIAGRPPAELMASLAVISLGEHFIRHGENAWYEAISGARVVLHTTSLGAALGACTAGLGCALLPTRMAEAAGLQRLPMWPVHHRDLWIVVHPDLARAPRVKAVGDFLAESVRVYAGAAATDSTGAA